MTQFNSKTAERKALSLLLKSPFHLKSLTLVPESFAYSGHRELLRIIRKYVEKYKSVPTKDTLISFCNPQLTNEKTTEKISEALAILSDLPDVSPDEQEFFFEKIEEYRIGRALFDLHQNMTDEFQKHDIKFSDLKKSAVETLLSIGTDDTRIKGGLMYEKEKVKERIHKYKEAEAGSKDEIIPFGITALDNQIGGMKKSFLSLIYSKTAGGKTTFAINVANNVAHAGHDVMYVSLEMAYHLIASKFDSLNACLNSKDIIFGRLNSESKRMYSSALKNKIKINPSIWIEDIPSNASVGVVLESLSKYKAIRGKYPDLTIIDYANLLEPTKRYNGRSEKFDFLMKELHEMTRYHETAGMTMMQESRSASEADIAASKSKKDAPEGVHNIGLSNYAAIHCELVIRLKQSEADKARDRLWAVIDKDRYGSSDKKIPLFAQWALSYIGDKDPKGLKIAKN